jgi:putative phosphoribosyl transferase
MNQLLAAAEQRPLRIPVGSIQLEADLSLPPAARGLVLFAHGSGSSRFSPRNRHVAERLNRAGLATVLADLLTPDEAGQDERTRELRFDIDLLGERLIGAIDGLQSDPATALLPIGLFGASTGAAAALVAAIQRPLAVRAVVSRGGRPDLVGQALAQVRPTTLLIVGSDDDPAVIALNRRALEVLTCNKQLAIVPHAGHLFEEAGALDAVATLASAWFLQHVPLTAAT